MEDYQHPLDAAEDLDKDSDLEEVDFEEITETNDVLLNALIDLLITKGLITEEEFNKKIEEFSEDEDDMEEQMLGQEHEQHPQEPETHPTQGYPPQNPY